MADSTITSPLISRQNSVAYNPSVNGSGNNDDKSPEMTTLRKAADQAFKQQHIPPKQAEAFWKNEKDNHVSPQQVREDIASTFGINLPDGPSKANGTASGTVSQNSNDTGSLLNIQS